MSDEDIAAIRRVVTLYVEGYLRADTEALKRAFAPDAVMNGYLEGRLINSTPRTFIENVGKVPSIESQDCNPSYQIGDVEIRGNAAAVTLQEYNFGDRNFTDFMHLIKFDGVWKIVSKTFSTF